MKVHIELNIYDVHRMVMEKLAETHPGVEITGMTVTSWNTTLFRTEGDKLIEPVAHRLDPEHSELK